MATNKERGNTVERNIKTRAQKSDCMWRTISIPDDLYSELAAVSDKRQESISLIVRKWLSECLKTDSK
jgi:hypothetical protein